MEQRSSAVARSGWRAPAKATSPPHGCRSGSPRDDRDRAASRTQERRWLLPLLALECRQVSTISTARGSLGFRPVLWAACGGGLDVSAFAFCCLLKQRLRCLHSLT